MIVLKNIAILLASIFLFYSASSHAVMDRNPYRSTENSKIKFPPVLPGMPILLDLGYDKDENFAFSPEEIREMRYDHAAKLLSFSIAVVQIDTEHVYSIFIEAFPPNSSENDILEIFNNFYMDPDARIHLIALLSRDSLELAARIIVLGDEKGFLPKGELGAITLAFTQSFLNTDEYKLLLAKVAELDPMAFSLFVTTMKIKLMEMERPDRIIEERKTER